MQDYVSGSQLDSLTGPCKACETGKDGSGDDGGQATENYMDRMARSIEEKTVSRYCQSSGYPHMKRLCAKQQGDNQEQSVGTGCGMQQESGETSVCVNLLNVAL